jgi:hypothetical protein
MQMTRFLHFRLRQCRFCFCERRAVRGQEYIRTVSKRGIRFAAGTNGLPLEAYAVRELASCNACYSGGSL